MAENDISIQRNLEQIKQGIADIGAASRTIDKDLKAVNAGLKFDPKNTELLAQKQELMADKLANSRERSRELAAAIAELNRMKAENGQLTDGQSKLLATYEQQLKNTSAEVVGLTGNVEKQIETNKAAEETTKSFSQSITEHQSKLRAIDQVMSGVIQGYEMLGGDKDSAIGKTLVQSQKSVQMMSSVMSMNKLLGSSNSVLSKSFGTLAMSAGAAIAAYSLGTSIINMFGEENRKIAGVVAITAAAVGGLAVAGLAAAGVLSWGAAVPIILGAVGVGAAGITALLQKETKTLKTAAMDLSSAGAGSTSMPDISTPSVPSYRASSDSGSGQSQTIVQTLSQRQITDAMYDAGLRLILEQGLNEPTIINKTTLTKGDIVRWIFSGILDPNTGTINAREVL